MHFINNWKQPITLATGQTECALGLPDGRYRLTVADSPGIATRWEYIDAEVMAGQGDLVRGLEGSADQDWPAGSVIYLSVTAGVLASLFEQLAALQTRVAALEGGGIPNNALTDANGNLLTGASGAILTMGETV